MITNWKLGLGFSLLTVLMWGLLPLALKAVLQVMDPVTISWYRFSLSALIALVWYGHRSGGALKQLLRGRQRALSFLTIAGLLCNYLFYIWGLDHINPGAVQILIQLAPLLLLLGSVVLFKDRLLPLQWLGVLGLVAGTLLFFHQRLTDAVITSDSYLVGVGLIIAAAVAWSVYGLAQKQLLTQHHTKDILLLICLAGTILFWPLAEPLQIMSLKTTELALLLFCGINTIVAYGSFGLAMSYWESSRVSATLPLTPLLTLLFTFALNRWTAADIPFEPIDWLSMVGAFFVVGGSAAAALPKNRPK
ncbi:putative inner membrane transporter YhbE [Halioglobus japonicus]|nr:putative inner membrane transporter YhbE [Halioglobus japonicus]